MHACVNAIQTVVSTLFACTRRSLQITRDNIKGLQGTNGCVDGQVRSTVDHCCFLLHACMRVMLLSGWVVELGI